MAVFLDTALFVRHITADHTQQSPRATAYFERIERGEVEAHTVDTVIFETVFCIAEALNDMPGLRVETVEDEAGRAIVRAAVHVDPAVLGRSAADLATFLAGSDPPIYLRSHHVPEGFVAVDPRPITETDARLIAERIRAFAAHPT